MRKRFLKLVEEHDPKRKFEYTVTLKDPSGKVENQFAVSGGDYVFDEFLKFKNKMTGVSEDDQVLDPEATAGNEAAKVALKKREEAVKDYIKDHEAKTKEIENRETNVV